MEDSNREQLDTTDCHRKSQENQILQLVEMLVIYEIVIHYILLSLLRCCSAK